MRRSLAIIGTGVALLAVVLLPRGTSPKLLAGPDNPPPGNCPIGKQCCWVLKERECIRKEYTPSREQSFPEFCSKTAGSLRWFMIYDDCWKEAGGGLPRDGGSTGEPNPGTGGDGDDDGDDNDGNIGGDGTGKGLPGGSLAGGTFPYCGNRVTDPGEECDDANGDNEDLCTSRCRIARCGDGFVLRKSPVSSGPQSNEECDDGNDRNDDDCTNQCKQTFCGDRIVQRYEECDPPGSIILPDGRALSGMECSNHCRVEITEEPEEGDTGDSGNLPPAPIVPPVSGLPPPPAPIPPPVPEGDEGKDFFLGCYGVDGSWTKDRSLCDLDQARHMRNVTDPETDRPLLPEKTLRNLTEEEEHAIQEALRKQFQEEERFKKKQLELLTLIENTMSRFQIIRDTYGLSEQSSGFLDAAVTWLQDSAAYFETKRTKDDVAFMAVSVKELLGRVEELVAAERTDGEVARGEEPDIVSLIARTEELTSAFRIGFGVLLREGLELPPEVYAAYGEAATKIADIRENCPRNPSSCSGLNDVLEALSTLKDPLQVGMEEVDADARTEIEAAFVKE